ncbi:MAG TPA: glycosyltransferase family 2 protein [Candidatus Saccharibacteria bacterium]|nr:glycosyltransferase family 2 protein [Candidatus Saccharibacteria bacterium]
MAKSSKQPKVAYIVVAWNNKDIIDECLDALKAQTYANTAIYLIDNASADGTADHVRKKYPEVLLTASDANNGFAKGNNILIKEALKDAEVGYVALINSDAVLDKDWTKELVDYLHDKTNVAAAQGITLDYYNHSVVDAEHVYIRKDLQAVQHNYGHQFERSQAHPRRVFGVNAAAAMYSRDFIEEQQDMTLFDEKFFMYLEDVDVSFRAIATGWDNYFVPTARAYHMGSVSAKKRSTTFNIQMTLRNQPALMFKNMPLRTFIALLPSALRFEKHFYRYIAQKHGKDDAKKAIKSRFVGLGRLPLYVGGMLWVHRHRKRSWQEIERIIRNDGIV